MGAIGRFFDNLRKRSGKRGYVCDHCGGEVFAYPTERLCKSCESKMQYPKRTCDKCGRQTAAEGLCLLCKGEPPKFDKGFSPFVYRGETAALVNRLKNGKPRLAFYFGEKMAECFAEKKEACEILVLPVPVTAEKYRERGYNQAERLAEVVVERLTELGFEAELDREILQKRRETALQKTLSFYERKDNVAGAFFVHKRKACRGKTLLLVDDIMTTGATGSACAEKLLAAGADKVIFLTAAALEERK